MWKLQDFSITQILREIKFGEFGSAKSAILTHLEALNFDFHAFLQFLKAENQIRAPNLAKRQFITSRFSKI